MLQGTFETLSLPEVLGLLASARKSGALRLEAGPVSGVVHLDDGHCCAAQAGEQGGAVEDGAALQARLVDLCFAVTRQENGAFRFADDETAPWICSEPVELSDVLVELDRILKQWREILRVIPSLECRPHLLEVLEVDELVVDRERWALLVAVDGRRTVRELVERAGRPMLDVCQALLELVEAGAVGVIDPAAAKPAVVATVVEAPVVEVPAEVVAPPAVVAPVAVEAPVALSVVPTPTPTAEAADIEQPAAAVVPAIAVANGAAAGVQAGTARETAGDDGSEAPDKGAFLRLFSGLRES